MSRRSTASRVRLRGGTAVLAAFLLTPLVATQAGAQSLEELRERRTEAAAQRAAIESRLAEAAAELDELQVRMAELEAERDELTAEVQELAAELRAVTDLIAVRVRGSYMHGANLDPLAVFLASDEPSAALSRAQTVHRLVAGDRSHGEMLTATRTRLEAAQGRLDERTRDLEAAQERQAEVAASLTRDLEEAKELEARLTAQERAERERLERERRERLERERREREERERREREERERRSAATTRTSSGSGGSGGGSGGGGSSGGGGGGVGSGGKACPLDHPRHFTDTWGAPRSGGRSHRGTDILGPYGIPVRAITSGTWSIQSPGPSAGLWAILRGDDGNQYWYMHLQSHTVGNGARVSAGQQVATNGDTGNARGTPHIHFELHPGGGSAINPYPLLKSVCG
ncbi:murein hydrolase activator EnvC [Egicoccus sp. AB-alg2]|uniref:murein hydrolase activator EnvC family protein n=1 Tax=Egicoccus sp. AB-alg2 TaxID=3242693 RepID=UPI00359CFD6A